MKKERPVGVAIFGWVFTVFSIFYLILIPKFIITFQKLFQISQQTPVEKGFIFGLPLSLAVVGFLGALLILIVGIGLLKVKPWAYYLAIIISVNGLVNVGWNVWFFGPQIFTPLQITTLIFVCIAIILYFIQKKTREVFQVDTKGFKKLKVTPKILIALLVVGISLRVLSIPLWVGYVHINFRDKLPLINLQPEKAEYKITDEEFIGEKCEKINLANISMYLPKEWKISSVVHSGELGWDLIFLYEKGDKIENFVLLSSEGSQPYFKTISKVLKFNSVYDLERKINYSKQSPLYLIMKTLGNPEELTSIEDVATFNWKGFIKINKQKELNRIILESSLYSLDGKQSAGFTLILNKDYMTVAQARNIIASFQFEGTFGEADAFFEEGKKALLKNEYKKAILHFINANAQDDKNPKYLYYLALSLYKDDNKTGRKIRLVSSEDFLKKTLELRPNYQEAEKLLLLVKQEIKQIDD